MKRKIVIITLLFNNFIFCQENTSDAKYKAETKSLINYILKSFLSTPYLNLSIEATATRVKIEDCKESYESPMFDKSELDYIKQSINNPLITYWTEEYFPALKLLEKKKESESENIYQGGTIATFSSPIFLRNFEIAIIRFSEVSGELSGSGFEGLFIKKGDQWYIDGCGWDN